MTQVTTGAVPNAGEAHRVTAVVPVKRLASAKSRLAVPENDRQALALAFAVDTISSLLDSALVVDVLVVASDPPAVRRLQSLGVRVVADPGTGLGGAIAGGIRAATTWRPGTGTAVVPADLPCLRATDVTQVVSQALATQGAFVPDRSGAGTTLVIHPAGCHARTRYGPASAAAHRAIGLQALHDAPVRARHDVDTLDDLEAAASLGAGAETLAVVQALDHALDRCAT